MISKKCWCDPYLVSKGYHQNGCKLINQPTEKMTAEEIFDNTRKEGTWFILNRNGAWYSK